MPKYITITGNLLAESTAQFQFPQEGKTTRAASDVSFQVGGKGVNTARALNKLSGRKQYAIIFLAGFTGQRCSAWLKKADFCIPLTTQIDGETREGLVCRNPKNGLETTFLGGDVKIPEHAFDNALDKIGKLARTGDFIAFCGSFAGWKDAYAKKLAKLCAKKNLRLCVDTYGKPLAAFSREKLFLLKINRDELTTTFGKNKNIKTLSASLFANTENFVVSNSNGEIFARLGTDFHTLTPPEIKREISATGCGDVLTASLMFELSRTTAPLDALKISVARASASAELAQTAVWREPRAHRLLKTLKK